VSQQTDHDYLVDRVFAAMVQNGRIPERAILSGMSDDQLQDLLSYYVGPFYVS
jgi:hypothetical protein